MGEELKGEGGRGEPVGEAVEDAGITLEGDERRTRLES